VLINVETEKSELLVNHRFAYLSVSRAQHDAHIYTNDGSKLSLGLSRESSQRTATEVEQQPAAPNTESVSQRGDGLLKRSKVIVSEWGSHDMRQRELTYGPAVSMRPPLPQIHEKWLLFVRT
jgi:hypothetical protein